MSIPTKKLSRKISKRKGLLILTLLILLPILTNYPLNFPKVVAHSPIASPKELFSLWNDTFPSVDGAISFSPTSLAAEWSSASVYSLFNTSNELEAKILLQNSDEQLFIAIDATTMQTATPGSQWGFRVYFDRDHDGQLSSLDRQIAYTANVSGTFVEYFSYANSVWSLLESGTGGNNLSSSNILASNAYGSSFFESNDHQMFELRVPLVQLLTDTGNTTGFALAVFEELADDSSYLTWPYISATPTDMSDSALVWGDLTLGVDFSSASTYAQYLIEDNFNIIDGALGYNNGSFISKGDINGDSDLELIVASNRTVVGETNLIAIYDYVGNSLTKIWSSTASSQQSNIFLAKDIAPYDFDQDGKDELYIVGNDSRILRLYDWNDTAKDFDSSAYVYTNSGGALSGHIAIGNFEGGNFDNIIAGDNGGKLSVLNYDNITDTFSPASLSPFTLSLNGSTVNKIHGLEAADIDDDNIVEVLLHAQYTTDDSIGTTCLHIIEKVALLPSDNVEDNLSTSSSVLTYDAFGHTVLTDDIDNNSTSKEFVLVGKEYLRLFRNESFSASEPPLELLIHDGSNSPNKGGGALIGDFDDDGSSELLVGCTNGTVLILSIEAVGAGGFSYSVEWSMDLGSSPGLRGGAVSFDIDEDGETEIILSDQFGQIFILGRGAAPTVAITSPAYDYRTTAPTILVEWTTTEDYLMHHYDIFNRGVFQGRAGGSQTGYLLTLVDFYNETVVSNTIEVVGYDITGKSDNDFTLVRSLVDAPEATIITPDGNLTSNSNIIPMEYSSFDPDSNFAYFDIYVNGILSIAATTTNESVTLPTVDGEYNITVVAVDAEGKTGKDTVFVTYDGTGPDVEITSPADNAFVTGSIILVQWTATDALTGYNHTDVYLDGVFVGSTTTFSYLVPLTIDKSYTVLVRAFDIAGNDNTDSITVVRDSVAPNATIASPITESITENNILTLEWEAEDNPFGSGVDFFEVRVNSVLRYSGTALTTDLDLGTDGKKIISLYAYDVAGNVGFDAIVVYYDSANPIVTITSPENNYNTSFTDVIINWQATDAGTGIQYYEVLVNSILVRTINDPLLTFSSITLSTDQANDVTIRAYDFLGNFGEDSITIVQNASAASFLIISPTQTPYYNNSLNATITWDYNNLPDLVEYQIYVNGTLAQTITNTSILSTVIDLEDLLGVVPIDQVSVYNITVLAISSFPSNNLSSTIWFYIDQQAPSVAFTNPANGSVVISYSFLAEWLLTDNSLSIAKQELLLDGALLTTIFDAGEAFKINLGFENGPYELSIAVYDEAGNVGTDSIIVFLYPQLPSFTIDLEDNSYSQTGEFTVNLDVADTQAGIKSITGYVDSQLFMLKNYAGSIKVNPFILAVSINSSIYTITDGSHSLSFQIFDIFDRAQSISATFNVDQTGPEIDDLVSLGSLILGDTATDLTRTNDNYTLSVTATDNLGFASVKVQLIGAGVNESYDLIPASGNTVQGGVFTYEFNFTSYEFGENSFIITAVDNAGNVAKVNYSIQLNQEQVIPWILQGNNVIYVSAGGGTAAILVILMAVMIQRRTRNLGWKDEIVAISYVFNGIPCVYMQASKELQQDEVLFGGAMTGIRGVLAEITGEHEHSEIQMVEVGQKKVLICPGKYGEAVLMVNKMKPIHKEKLLTFTLEFEKKYDNLLRDEELLIEGDTFMGASIIVDTIFGIRENFEYIEECDFETIEGISASELEAAAEPVTARVQGKKVKLQPEDFDTISEILQLLPQEQQDSLLALIQLSQQAITALLETQLGEASIISNRIVQGLEQLLRQVESPKILDGVVRALVSISKKIFDGISLARNNDFEGAQKAAEEASNIWFKEIGDKWSEV